MLAGRTVLIVETEFLIALSMQAVLQGLGTDQFIVFTSAEEALRKRPSWENAGLAILEIEARHPDQIELAQAAIQAGIPTLGLTADSLLKTGTPELPDIPFLVKPVPDEDLVNAVLALTSHSVS